jgi:hypothetical protein
MSENKIRKSYPGVPFAKPKTKVGRPKGKIYTVRKEILLTPDQAKKWNPDKIRNFLENGNSKKIPTVRESKDEIIPDLTKLLTKNKNKIPIELYRSLKLIFRIIEER